MVWMLEGVVHVLSRGGFPSQATKREIMCLQGLTVSSAVIFGYLFTAKWFFQAKGV